MRLRLFYLNTSRSFIISALFALTLSRCGSQPEVELPPLSENPYRLQVVNSSTEVVDAIQFKPCGTPEKHYATLTTGIKPNQKVILNVYNVCIDVIAVDAFRQTLYEQDGFNMNQHTTWKIK
jgi:hypothetical protein